MVVVSPLQRLDACLQNAPAHTIWRFWEAAAHIMRVRARTRLTHAMLPVSRNEAVPGRGRVQLPHGRKVRGATGYDLPMAALTSPGLEPPNPYHGQKIIYVIRYY